ncbi:MAG: squalene/phytoene synthase family protein [Chloroflexota bacterium]|nr:squalene/phytoene synthase family protein [Chloroflexota bacterium]
MEINSNHNQTKKKYLNAMMNQVSRSFALVTPCLEDPLNDQIATAYLICRVIDNIEDSNRSSSWQNQRFAECRQLLINPKGASSVLSHWDQMNWPGLSPGERKLMGVEDGLTLWKIYLQFPDEIKYIITNWVSAMAVGMSGIKSLTNDPYFIIRNGTLISDAEEDYNQYCYYVAGTVGHLATELAVSHYKLTDSVANRLLVNCEACGRGLQKTNIIKDFAKDLARGICYLPNDWLREVDYIPLSLSGAPLHWKRKVLLDILDELRASVDYVLDIPYSATGYRMASLLCLLPAYETISMAAENQSQLFTADHHVKISRETMFRCMQGAQAMVNCNDDIVKYGRDRSSKIMENL